MGGQNLSGSSYWRFGITSLLGNASIGEKIILTPLII
jgi:hypothetical protein